MNTPARIFAIGFLLIGLCSICLGQLTFQRTPTPLGPISVDKFLTSGNTAFALRHNENQTGYYFYRSADNGINWSLDSTRIIGDIVAWGTGNVLALNAHTVMRSTNYGASWVNDTCDFPDKVRLNTLVHTPSGTLLAFTGGYVSGGTNLDRLYRSTNNGAHWSLSGDSIQVINAIATGRTLDGTIFTMTEYTDSTYRQFINVNRSTNDGTTWSPDTTMEIMIWADDPAGYPVGLAAGLDSSIYVVTTQEVFRKVYNGNHWDLIGHGVILTNMEDISAFAVNQRDELYANLSSYYRGYGLFRSTNHGATWVRGTGRPDTLRISQLYFGSNGIGFCCGCQNYRTTDGGTSWTPSNIDRCQSGLYNLFSTSSGSLIGQSPQALLTNYRSLDRGLHWQSIFNGLPLLNDEILSFIDHGDSVLSACVVQYPNTGPGIDDSHYYVFHSTNDGSIWNQVHFDSTYMDGMITLEKGINGSVIGHNSRYFVSRDYGLTWHTHRLLNSLYNTTFLALANNTYLAFSDSISYYANSSNHFYIASDDSTQWTLLNSVSFCIRSLYQTRSGAILAAHGYLNERPLTYSVFRSTNSGVNWTQILPTTDQQPVFPLTVNATGDLFGFDTLGKIMQSVDEGLTWQQIGPDTVLGGYYSKLVVDRDGFLYFVNTDNYAFYRTTTSTVGVRDLKWIALPMSPLLYQNYPNPFNSTTRISFSLPRAEKITLSIYDALGRKVTTLLNNESVMAGKHSTEWNVSTMPSGTYFTRLQVGNEFQTSKMTILE